MRGAKPTLPNTPSWRGALLSTGKTLPLTLHIFSDSFFAILHASLIFLSPNWRYKLTFVTLITSQMPHCRKSGIDFSW
jgi:hypothetical protein